MNAHHDYVGPVLRSMALTIAVIAGAAGIAAATPTPFAAADGPRLWAILALIISSCLALYVARLARHRLNHERDASPAEGDPSPAARSLRAQLQNTLEQAVLAVAAYAAWIVLTPPRLWMIAVAAAALFVIGRGLFTLGYAGGPRTRALGFTLTFYPTLGLIGAGLIVAVLG
jgi:uncharacterized MAPEG superfamily protein